MSSAADRQARIQFERPLAAMVAHLGGGGGDDDDDDDDGSGSQSLKIDTIFDGERSQRLTDKLTIGMTAASPTCAHCPTHSGLCRDCGGGDAATSMELIALGQRSRVVIDRDNCAQRPGGQLVGGQSSRTGLTPTGHNGVRAGNRRTSRPALA
jgi:hypothetical protein